MLTIKAPLEITAKTSYVKCSENFYHRIMGNYSLMETRVDEEDLLHITNTPPEIYVTEGEGISSVLNQSVRNENNYNKVEILNNVLNRIVASASVNLTYQDRVFITDSLYRLGIRDDHKFMNAFYEMSQQTRDVNALINLYLEKSENLRIMLEAVNNYNESRRTMERQLLDRENQKYVTDVSVSNNESRAENISVTNVRNAEIRYEGSEGEGETKSGETALNALERERISERERLQKERENYLFNTIFDRLSTGAIYQIVSNFNRSENYNEMEKAEYSISDQTYAAQNLLLSVMRERVFPGDSNLVLLNTNTYEEELESFITSAENVRNEISSAVLMRLLQNIYRTGFDKFYFDRNTYFKFEDTFYKASDEIVTKLITNIGASQIKNEISRQVINVNESQISNEFRLFDYATMNELSRIDIESIQEMIDQLTVYSSRTGQLLEEYNSASFSYRTGEVTSEKKELTRLQLEVLRILGQVSDSETIRTISEKIMETAGQSGDIYKVLSEYIESMNSTDIINEFIRKLITENNIQGLISSGEAGESSEEIRNAVTFLRNEIHEDEETREILNRYLSLYGGSKEQYSLTQSNSFSNSVIQLINLITGKEAVSEQIENPEIIKNFISGDSNVTIEEIRGAEELKKAALFLRDEVAAGNNIQEILNRYSNIIEGAAPSGDIFENTVLMSENLQLIQLLGGEESADFSLENLELIKNYIRSSMEITNKDKKYYLDTITFHELEALEKLTTTVKAETDRKQELIKLLKESKKVKVSEEKTQRIKEIITELGITPEMVTVFFEEDQRELPGAGESEEISSSGKNTKAPFERAELIFERVTEEEGQAEGSNLFINRNELIALIKENTKEMQSLTMTRENVRDYIRQIRSEGEKRTSGYVESGSGYELYKPVAESDTIPSSEISVEPSETENPPVKEGDNVTDADIRKITESVNRIEALNEQRRTKYIEEISKIRESLEESGPRKLPFEKTRQVAALTLESPEKLMETLNHEKEIRSTREKEILSRIKDIFPEQSYEIYRLLEKYQRNEENPETPEGLRTAEVGELIYDINHASEPSPEPEKEGKIEASEEIKAERARVRLDRGEVLTEEHANIRPVETIHKYQESLTSDEINEQLQLMQHNISKQIKEDVKSDVITSNNYINSREVITNSNVSEQLNAVNIQRMIDSKIQSEMNTISNRVMNKIERQMRNEKARRGY
ncbi:hypothetical protein [Butyrivibrio sp. AE3009]|uniref:hypothetical protein n=1 Tax=Butyrivibrio sp. AE3009 TaxID=1280666 RepID=UPI000416A189|nr:hypothetical protein [Butyrivibrio sp. AE3009]